MGNAHKAECRYAVNLKANCGQALKLNAPSSPCSTSEYIDFGLSGRKVAVRSKPARGSVKAKTLDSYEPET